MQTRTAPRTRREKNAEASRKAILDAALVEFSTQGFDGARVDTIAARAGVSKPLIYDYYGDKEALYGAALLEAYVQIRQGEQALDLEGLEPDAAIRKLVRFTMDHFRENPWFIAMLNTENLRGGETIRSLRDAAEIQSGLMRKLKTILDKGVEKKMFRPGVDPAELYIFIASMCYFPLSNRHTLRMVFKAPIDDAWLERRAREAGEMILQFLRPR
ncbi:MULTISPECIES: TetR/AcrR family transcriptional regulator [unclassified Roseitalea]|uniref:TetR/AcrR family transcriptional regulator n=1 Tax=unclassified Roseitalea TaxID=2639107 RepID=UPI00273FC89D|nr:MULTISPECIES: TetR/AcrR family transcriptional regulator [unclassified Roseitalea]